MLKSLMSVVMIAASLPSPSHAEVLDYGNAFYFAPDSSVNRLFIEVTGRLRFREQDNQKEYYLLYSHPREDTWREDGKVYEPMISRSGGASNITFIIGSEGDAVFSRRYESPPWFSSDPHHCSASPYKDGNPVPPAPLDLTKLTELNDFEGVLAAAEAGGQIIGLASYSTNDGTPVRIDFPVRVLNINPATRSRPDVPEGQQWQIASSKIPIYIDGETDCERIRSGHLATGDFNGNIDFVYLCQSGILSRTVDMNCTMSYPGTLRLFTRGDERD